MDADIFLCAYLLKFLEPTSSTGVPHVAAQMVRLKLKVTTFFGIT